MSIASKSLDELFSGTPTGSIERAILNNLTGINHLQTPNALPNNKELPGFTFFTRPQLNMQKGNIRNVRKLYNLLTDNDVSIQKYIRCCLDPRLALGVSYSSGSIPPSPCPVIDNSSPFIIPFTNNLLSISGWPSIAVPTRNSDPGLYNEVQTLVDGRVINDEAYTLNCNFRNTRGDAILFLLYVWSVYMSMVFEGKMVPYLDMISENEIDYNTRIYRIVTDHTRRRITKMYCCHAAVPKGVPIGDGADIPGDRTYSDANQTMSVQFECNGFTAFDDIIAMEFNAVGEIFNPDLSDENRENRMVRVPESLLRIFNFSGYPRIDTVNSTLDWWVSKDVYNERTARYFNMIPDYNPNLEEGS